MASICFPLRPLIAGFFMMLLAAAAPCAVSAQPLSQGMAPPTLVGPKPTLAVGMIEASGGYRYSSWYVGNGLRSMLTRALEESGQLTVVERANSERGDYVVLLRR